MKVSLNTVKQYTQADLPLDELVYKVNSQLGGVEEVIDLAAKYKDAVIVKIVEVEPHPNADRLRVTKIDDGGVTPDVPRDEDGLVQVVCGAPNARAGIMAVWLPPKSTVPASFEDKDPFVLDARELRGVLSQGMLAAPDELAISSDHEGILEITQNDIMPQLSDFRGPALESLVGQQFSEIFGLNDTVLEIENKMFTHRPDCFGVLGVAREIAGIQHQKFTSPEWYTREPGFVSGEGLKLTVTNDAPERAQRFMAVAIKDVSVKPSPLWLQCELVRLGAKPINNIVDVTNYVMLLTAQPTHAYDYDKLRGNALGVRLAKKDEKITLLNHKTYELKDGDLVIVDGEGPVGLAGIMGGGESEVSNETKNIVLECASFDMYTLRKSSMRHGVFTDALTRFNKGQSPLQNPYILELLIRSISDVAGGEIASQIFDQSAELKPHVGVKVSVDFINERLGMKLSAEDMAKLLTNVEFEVKVKGNELTVTPGFWRTDIELPEDVVEEVGRLYGFDKLPRELPRRSITPATQNVTFEAKRRIRHTLARLGANEVLGYSFVHENLLKRAGQDASEAFRLGNALSPDLQYYRLSLTPSLLAQVHPNIKAGHDEFLIFEIGKVHGKSEIDDDGLPKEFGRVSLVFAAEGKTARAKYSGAPYYMARRYVTTLLETCAAISRLRCVPLDEAVLGGHKLATQMVAPYDPQRSAFLYHSEKLVGVLGEYKQSVSKQFKLPEYAAGFEIFLSALSVPATGIYHALSRFPSVTQDISLKVGANVAYAEVEDIARGVVMSLDPEKYRAELSPLNIYQPENTEDKTITLRLTVFHYLRTLTDKEVSEIIDAIADATAQKIDAVRV